MPGRQRVQCRSEPVVETARAVREVHRRRVAEKDDAFLGEGRAPGPRERRGPGAAPNDRDIDVGRGPARASSPRTTARAVSTRAKAQPATKPPFARRPAASHRSPWSRPCVSRSRRASIAPKRCRRTGSGPARRRPARSTAGALRIASSSCSCAEARFARGRRDGYRTRSAAHRAARALMLEPEVSRCPRCPTDLRRRQSLLRARRLLHAAHRVAVEGARSGSIERGGAGARAACSSATSAATSSASARATASGRRAR